MSHVRLLAPSPPPLRLNLVLPAPVWQRLGVQYRLKYSVSTCDSNVRMSASGSIPIRWREESQAVSGLERVASTSPLSSVVHTNNHLSSCRQMAIVYGATDGAAVDGAAQTCHTLALGVLCIFDGGVWGEWVSIDVDADKRPWFTELQAHI